MFHGTVAEQAKLMGLNLADCCTWYYHIQDVTRGFAVMTPPHHPFRHEDTATSSNSGTRNLSHETSGTSFS